MEIPSTICSFQSTPSAWRETFVPREPFTHKLFQSTPSAWRETSFSTPSPIVSCISIHSLRMEGDCYVPLYSECPKSISIHSLRMEGDYDITAQSDPENAFQSTPSAWRETFSYCAMCTVSTYFNPLPPHGGRLMRTQAHCSVVIFQSTPSAWRETNIGNSPHCPSHISIHSLRMEGDSMFWNLQPTPQHFNPLPPHGGRLISRIL